MTYKKKKKVAKKIADLVNKAVYTAALVACWWAGAVKSKRKRKKTIAN